MKITKKTDSIRKAFVTYRVYGEGQILWHDQALFLTKKEIGKLMDKALSVSKKNEDLLKELK